MRVVCLLIALAGTARADGIGVGASIGAGAQGDATYSGVELGADAAWHGVRVGVGGRGVWLDGEWRGRDWERAIDAVRAIRLVEASAGPVAMAGGALAPAYLAHVVAGHRAALDDRPRTGARVAVGEAAMAEIDDVLDPSLVGAAGAWEFARPWVVHGAGVIDPSAERSQLELSIGHRWRGDAAIAEVGGGFVGEPELGGASGIVFVDAAIDRAGLRWFGSAEARAGSGTVGAAFGPLHRIERAMMMFDARVRGAGGAIAIGVAGEPGWVRAAVRARPEHGVLVDASAAAPLWKWLQAGAWIAASRDATAGACEVRVAWARRYSTRIELARMYDTDLAMPVPAFSATAWFGITSD